MARNIDPLIRSAHDIHIGTKFANRLNRMQILQTEGLTMAHQSRRILRVEGVFGTEHAGVSDEIIEAADEYLRIPMCGMVESLNVSASAAILIYMLSQRMRLSPSIDWHLSEEENRELFFRWVMSSVRDAERILEREFSDK